MLKAAQLTRMFALLLMSTLLWSPAVAEEEFAICEYTASDPDGDGWGWEYEQSCRVTSESKSFGDNMTEALGYEVCRDIKSDPDSDGWGWEDNASCMILIGTTRGTGRPDEIEISANGYAYCFLPTSDPDGDGWGWENNASCVVRNSTADPNPAKKVSTPAVKVELKPRRDFRNYNWSDLQANFAGQQLIRMNDKGQLQDPNGEPLLARGIDLYYANNPIPMSEALPAISQAGSNVVRVWVRRATSAQQIAILLDKIAEQHMLAIISYVDDNPECSENPIVVDKALEMFLDKWSFVLLNEKFHPYVMLSVTHRWGKADLENYVATYQNAILELRAAGYPHTLVLDAPGCGTDSQNLVAGIGKRILAADPLQNTLFGVHAFGWGSNRIVNERIDELRHSNLPFIFTGFANSHLDADRKTQHWELMRLAQKHQIGWIATSWRGNICPDCVMDISNSFNQYDLTFYGKQVVEGKYGLLKTSRKASIF